MEPSGIAKSRLVVVRGALAGQSREAGEAPLTIGRAADNRLRLPDPQVSRHHCVIERAGGGVVVRDLGSRLGTLVNGKRVAEQRLEDGDVVRMAATELLFLARELSAEALGADTGSTADLAGEGEPGRCELVGESAAMARVRGLLAQAAVVDSTVMLRGESGTGKELAATALHRLSRRARGPLVAINCASLSPTLFESELFGHEKGAFTGAHASREGKLEAAHGGTLFLDEVGEIPLELQARLLRVLQERKFERVGSNKLREVDLRLVAATNRDLEKAIRAGTFREDLYYRLKVITIELPPLRARSEDIPLLAGALAEGQARRLGRRPPAFTAAALAAMARYSWPGNVRELANAIERALVLGSRETLDLRDLPDEVARGAGEQAEVALQARGDFARKARDLWAIGEPELRAALEAADFRPFEAARILGIPRPSIYHVIRRFPAIRLAADLDRAELEGLLARHRGDLPAMAKALSVSLLALRRRLGQLGLQA